MLHEQFNAMRTGANNIAHKRVLIILVLAICVVGVFVFMSDSLSPTAEPETMSISTNGEYELKHFGLNTDTSKKSIDLSRVLSGGPGKDGIPAINDPKFTNIAQASLKDDALGIFIEFERERRFYPYSILVWHEIVNDTVGGIPIAVTFCPLCGTGIVFDRRVDGEELIFGVSGLLFESNLLMYDSVSESLWSQARNEAVVGPFTGVRLTVLPMQLITFAELKRKYPEARVLSKNTGHQRNYDRNPYSGYNEDEGVLFPVSYSDKRYFAKEIFYVMPIDTQSVATPYNRIPKDKPASFVVNGKTLSLKRDGDEVRAVYDEKPIPGYFEMWFSWIVHHKDDGLIVE